MPVIADLSNVDSLYFGTTEIVKAYAGTSLLYQKSTSSPYEIDEVVFQRSTSGTETLNLLATGKYEVYCIAGGGGAVALSGGFFAVGCGGGSGSGFVGVIRMSQGNYTLTVGVGGTGVTSSSQTAKGETGGDSSIGSLIISHGGEGGKLSSGTSSGGTAPTITATVISSSVNRAGYSNNGSADTNYGGQSVYGGYGKGGDYLVNGGGVSNGVSGFVKIIYKGE